MKCVGIGCDKWASFGEKGGYPLYCKAHKYHGMTNLHSKKCIHPDCEKRASYNYYELAERVYCKTHAKRGMVNVASLRCQWGTCRKIACWSFEEEIPSRCNRHKVDGMLQTRPTECEVELCDKPTSYGYLTDNYPRYCKEHSKEGMVNHRRLTCSKPGCNLQGNLTNTMFPSCSLHSHLYTFNASMCQVYGCGDIAEYTDLFETKRVCKLHSEPEMLSIETLNSI
uniref:Uncharacterized protein n=1 Tax=viral metagenome TaxID=1070528 RepID=A0A6C0JXT9_9ZZZZ